MFRTCIASLVLVVLLGAGIRADDSNVIQLRATSELCLDDAEALRMAHASLIEQLVALAKVQAPTLDETLCRHELPHQLATAPDVQRVESVEQIQKPYGTLFRRAIEIRLPVMRLSQWCRNLEYQSELNTRRTVIRPTIVLALWLLEGIGAAVLDRLTSGYRRQLLVAVLVPIYSMTIVFVWLFA